MSTASRRFLPVRGSLDREIIMVHAIAALDNVGAVSDFYGKGVSTMEKTGVGQYKITLDRKYVELLHINVIPATAFSDIVWTLVADNLSVDGSIDVATSDFAGQKDTAIGLYVAFQLVIKNSSIVG